MIDKPTKIGNSELYKARVLNMAVAQYFGLMKEYAEMVNQTPLAGDEELHKEKPLSLEQLNLRKIYKVRQDLNKLIRDKLNKEKIRKFGADKRWINF